MLYVSEAIRLCACRAAHAIDCSPVALRKPSAQQAGVNGKGKHLREIAFKECFRTVNHILKQTVGPLVSEAAVYQIDGEGYEALPIVSTAVRKHADQPRKSRRRPAIPTSPEFLGIPRFRAVVPAPDSNLLRDVNL